MAKEVKFEEKMQELESIISDLENGEIDLDESIAKYTRAMTLVKECDDKLKNVEEQISKMVTENDEIKDFEIERDA